MDPQSEWLWTEVVRASHGATTEIQFLELLIGHIRFLIKELKTVIKESCETVFPGNTKQNGNNIVVLDHTMCMALDIIPESDELGTFFKIKNNGHLIELKHRYIDLRELQQCKDEVSLCEKDEKPHIKEEISSPPPESPLSVHLDPSDYDVNDGDFKPNITDNIDLKPAKNLKNKLSIPKNGSTRFKDGKQKIFHLIQQDVQPPDTEGPDGFFSCQTCMEKQASWLTLKEHAKAIHSQIICSLCGDYLNNNLSCIYRHVNIKHQALKEPKKVAKFEKTEKDQAKVKEGRKKTYQLIQQDIPPPDTKGADGFYSCRTCTEKQVSWLGLKEHAKTAHNLIICGLCGDYLRNDYGTIYSHFYSRHKAKEVCEICGKSFPSNVIKFHRKKHLDDDKKPHVCRFCGKGFTDKQAHIAHENIHQGLQPHICEHCGKGFASKGNLSVHIKAVHLGIKVKPGSHKKKREPGAEEQFICKMPNCTKRYHSISSLKKHLRTVHGQSPEEWKRELEEKRKQQLLNKSKLGFHLP